MEKRRSKPSRILMIAVALCGLAAMPARARAFCGFYVGKSDTSLYNHASQVVMVRHDDKTVLSLMNDYQGEPSDFALVVPVPEILKREQISRRRPRTVQSHRFIQQPASGRILRSGSVRARMMMKEMAPMGALAARTAGAPAQDQAQPRRHHRGAIHRRRIRHPHPLGHATTGLETWLHETVTASPPARRTCSTLTSAQIMKFFVARVNLDRACRGRDHHAAPLAVRVQSPKFMLPIRLGMANADGAQDLLIYTLTRRGRVETH